MKRTNHITYIAILLLPILLLSLLIGCGKTQSRYATATPEIPDGWEVVSTDGNVTHLRMKEGSEAYYWINDLSSYQLGEDGTILMDAQIAGNKEKAPLSPDKDGNLYFILYFGHFYAKKIDGTYKLVEPVQDTRELGATLRIQHTGSSDIFGNTGEYDFLSERWALDEMEEYNNVAFVPTGNKYYDDPQAHVGLTQAVLIAIPYDKLDAVEDDWTSLLFHTYSDSMGHTLADAYQPCTAWKGNAYFQPADLEAEENPLFNKWFGIISLALLLCSMIVMVLSAVFKKNSFLHLIPIVIGILFGVIALHYHADFPYPDDIRGVGLAEFLMIFVYIIAGVILLIIRLLIGLIRRLMLNARQKE